MEKQPQHLKCTAEDKAGCGNDGKTIIEGTPMDMRTTEFIEKSDDESKNMMQHKKKI